jgi:chromate transporter
MSRDDEGGLAVPFGAAVRTWCRVAALSFGGPAGQIAVMHRILVDEKRWISEERFLHALNYCMLLPGPEAQQLATYVGWLLHGARGGLVAGVLFVLPGFLSILVLSVLYVSFQQTQLVQALFFGLKPAVLAIVLEAVWRIGRRVLKQGASWGVAAGSFAAAFALNVPFPILISAAGLIGLAGGWLAPAWFCPPGHAGQGRAAGAHGPQRAPAESERHSAARRSVQPTLRRSLALILLFALIWFGPLAALGTVLGWTSIWVQQGVFFSKAAVVTFGGAYAVLTYLAQQAVERYGWLKPGEMLDGLGMAETTPGPLIQVVQFVGFMGAYRNPGSLHPLAAGILASVVTTWVTYVPCFLWVFLGAPYVERLRGLRLLNTAMSTITAAVAGVVLNLAVWFSLHTLFGRVDTRHWFAMRLLVPVPESLHGSACAVAVLALLLTFWWKRGMGLTLASCAAFGALLYWLAR